MTVDSAFLAEDDEAYYDEDVDEGIDDAEWRPRRVNLPRTRSAPPRPNGRPVTQAQLQMAVNRLDGYINRNSAAIKKVNASVATLGRDVRRQTKDVAAARDAIMMLPLLDKLFPTDSPLTGLLPFLLLGSSSGQNTGTGGLFGGDSTTMMVMVLALSNAFNK